MRKFVVDTHPNGYVVKEASADRGISTHADIAEAIATCRVANRFARDSHRQTDLFGLIEIERRHTPRGSDQG